MSAFVRTLNQHLVAYRIVIVSYSIQCNQRSAYDGVIVDGKAGSILPVHEKVRHIVVVVVTWSRSTTTTITTTTTTIQQLLLHPFNGLFSRTTWISRYQKGNTSLDLNEARDDGLLGCSGISWTICKQSAPHSRQITTQTRQ